MHVRAESLRRTVRYHLGSVAAGSFVVAVVQFIRLVLEYINRKTKQAQEHNQALKFLMCCFRCCAWYTEQVVTFVNRNAYIMIAVKGTGYCPSAMRAVALIVQNALRLAAVNTFGDVLLWLGKARGRPPRRGRASSGRRSCPASGSSWRPRSSCSPRT